MHVCLFLILYLYLWTVIIMASDNMYCIAIKVYCAHCFDAHLILLFSVADWDFGNIIH